MDLDTENQLQSSLNKVFENLNNRISNSIFSLNDPQLKTFLLLLLESYQTPAFIPPQEMPLDLQPFQKELDDILKQQSELINSLKI